MIINVSNDAIGFVKELAANYSKSIRRDSADFYMLYYLNFMAHAAALLPVANGLGINASSKVIEIGSGIGTRCLMLSGLINCDVTGLEPHPKTYEALSNCISEMLGCNPHLRYTPLNRGGEATELNSFEYDYVLSFEVLEHVQNPRKVLQETYRLLKPGGKAFFSTCNYDSFYEGHYRMFWNPFASKEENRQRIVRKALNPNFLDELNFITKKQIMTYVEETGFSKITLNPVYPVAIAPDISTRFPPDFVLPSAQSGKPSFLQKMIQKPSVAGLLGLVGREYKLYLELVK